MKMSRTAKMKIIKKTTYSYANVAFPGLMRIYLRQQLNVNFSLI